MGSGTSSQRDIAERKAVHNEVQARMDVQNEMEDRISDLPKDLLDSILERMPIRDAAQTSILSTKWRHFWASRSRLVFDEQFYREITRNQKFINYEFAKIIDEVLLIHRGSILKFNLYIPNVRFEHKPDFERWVHFLKQTGIKELTLDNYKWDCYKLPSSVFSCSKLTHLKLRKWKILSPGACEGFGNLISLDFRSITFTENMCRTLVATAPMLKTLTIKKCICIEHLRIHTPNLQVFVVVNSHHIDWKAFNSPLMLTTAHIALCRMVENSHQEKNINLVKFVGNMPKIEKLKLDGFCLKFLAADNVPKRLLATANFLKNLSFHRIKFKDLDQISCALCLLNSSQNLQNLKLWVSSNTNGFEEPVLNYLGAPGCMNKNLDRLRNLELRFFKGSRGELLFLKLLLSYSPSLETMTIMLSRRIGANERFRISRELREFHRTSTEVKIMY